MVDILNFKFLILKFNEINYNPFLIASKNGYLKLVKMLLSRGADTEVKNENGDTPLLEGRNKILTSLVP